MSWDATGYSAAPRQVFAVTRSMLVRSLLISIGMIVLGLFLTGAGRRVGFGPLWGLGVFGWRLVASAVIGIGRAK